MACWARPVDGGWQFFRWSEPEFPGAGELEIVAFRRAREHFGCQEVQVWGMFAVPLCPPAVTE